MITELASGATGYANVVLSNGRKRLFKYPLEREWICKSILSGGRYSFPRTEADAKVRRVLDIGAGEGSFMVHAWVRWPGCWVDWYEPDERLAKFCQENAVPGAKRIFDFHTDRSEYDVVRTAIYPRVLPQSARQIEFEDWVVSR